MKIFDWVHRRFAHKEELAESGKKSCVIDDGDDVRDNSNAFNVFDGWKEGILTIGTLGYDPLKDDVDKQQQEYESDGEITDSEDEEEEANPLVYAAAAAAAAYAHDCEALLQIKGESSSRVNEEDQFDFETEFDAMIMSIPKKERITLAELFTADSEKKLMQKKLPDQKLGEETMMMKENKPKLGFSFAKKLIGDKDARPIQKLHRLMRMMLKRKIHPDQGATKQNCVKSSNTCQKTSIETASLLPAPVADAMM